MALPKEPRQKMINLMYLVLTALLALNVSAEILNAFKTVDNSLKTANSTIDSRNADLFKSFDALKKDPKTAERANIWAPLADRARTSADSVHRYIEDLKLEILKAAGYDPPEDTTFKEDDLEAATRIMSDPGTKGDDLLAKLTAFKTNLLNIHPDIKNEFTNILPLDLSTPKSSGDIKKDWAATYFNMVPTVAALTILSKFDNDVKNSEAMVIDFCHRQVGEVQFVIDQYKPLIGQNTNYAMPGQEIIITAGIGAYSKAAQPSITIDGSNVSINADGIAEYKTTAGGPGSYSKKVRISYINQATNQKEFKDVEVLYSVGSPTGISVSAEAVKVLYIGLDNPVSIKGGAKGAETISASISAGKLDNKGNGNYIATVSTAGNTTISVKNNETGAVENFNFKVRNVPNPTPKIGRFAGGRVPANEFKAQIGLRADLEEFVFEGVKYEVTGYTVICTGKGFESIGPQVAENTGAAFSGEARRIIDMCKPGSSVIFDRITVRGPGGSRTLPQTVAFNLY